MIRNKIPFFQNDSKRNFACFLFNRNKIPFIFCFAMIRNNILISLLFRKIIQNGKKNILSRIKLYIFNWVFYFTCFLFHQNKILFSFCLAMICNEIPIPFLFGEIIHSSRTPRVVLLRENIENYNTSGYVNGLIVMVGFESHIKISSD